MMLTDAIECPILCSTPTARYLAIRMAPTVELKGLCLLLPGSGPLDVDGQVGANCFNLQLALALAEHHLPSVRFGKRPLSSMRLEAVSYEQEYVEPVMAVFDALRNERACASPVVIIGHSLGGHVAPLVARHVGDVRGIVLLNAPFQDLATIAQAQLAERPGNSIDHPVDRALRGLETQSEAGEDRVTSLAAYFSNTRKYDPIAAFADVIVPVLVIGCEMDAQVRVDETHLWVAALEHTHCIECERMPGLNHLCMPAKGASPASILLPGEIDRRVIERVAAWTRSRLSA